MNDKGDTAAAVSPFCVYFAKRAGTFVDGGDKKRYNIR